MKEDSQHDSFSSFLYALKFMQDPFFVLFSAALRFMQLGLSRVGVLRSRGEGGRERDWEAAIAVERACRGEAKK